VFELFELVFSPPARGRRFPCQFAAWHRPLRLPLLQPLLAPRRAHDISGGRRPRLSRLGLPAAPPANCLLLQASAQLLLGLTFCAGVRLVELGLWFPPTACFEGRPKGLLGRSTWTLPRQSRFAGHSFRAAMAVVPPPWVSLACVASRPTAPCHLCKLFCCVWVRRARAGAGPGRTGRPLAHPRVCCCTPGTCKLLLGGVGLPVRVWSGCLCISAAAVPVAGTTCITCLEQPSRSSVLGGKKLWHGAAVPPLRRRPPGSVRFLVPWSINQLWPAFRAGSRAPSSREFPGGRSRAAAGDDPPSCLRLWSRAEIAELKPARPIGIGPLSALEP